MADRRARFSLGRYDWDAIAGIVAAGAALVLHLLHIIETDVLLTIALVVLALLLFRDLRREAQDELLMERSERTETAVAGLLAGLKQPDALLIGPRELRTASEAFARRARGEMVWFNVCLLMFKPQSLFDALLRPALENPAVSAVQFVLDPSERERWEQEVLPKAQAAGGYGKLREPRWVPLSHEAVSFILADTATGTTEAHLSFWGEPFMSRQPGFDIPRYVFHVQAHSDLVGQLVELDRKHRHAG
ncbi:MAG: hypothetical protein M9925_13620 [Chloroflexi bacterium]|nr:hypothetical protein [Dehalococcoidia bacterium]MCO5202731.1 hypothetical protein [Chloroflexota bacterium]MCZ7577568.1 hypothetical protein [Dehalococcoidia bacterium]NJD65488.1 hypothetical protein [Chloroflexota bacterium]PWB43589.1 MAG: hypothetical protein C3F10_10635 [Dehalococcoidia bacterium]